MQNFTNGLTDTSKHYGKSVEDSIQSDVDAFNENRKSIRDDRHERNNNNT